MTSPIRPRVRDDLAVVELDGEVVIYDEGSGDLHHLNPTATLVFSMCDGTATIAELAADIGEVFDLPTDDVERQVRSLLRQLRRQRLLEATSPSGDRAARNGNGKVAARG